MNDDARTLRLLKESLDLLPIEAPQRLLHAVMTGVESTGQRGRARLLPEVVWPARWRPQRAMFLVAGTAIAIVVAVAFAQFGLNGRSHMPGTSTVPLPSVTATPRLTPAPLVSAQPLVTPSVSAGDQLATAVFSKPFTLVAPPSAEVRVAVDLAYAYVLLSPPSHGGTFPLPPLTGSLYQPPYNGLIVESMEFARVDTCPRHLGANRIGDKPEQLMADLHSLGGMTVEATETTIDGRRAWLLNVAAECLDHLHVPIRAQTLGDAIELTRSSARTWLIEVGDSSVMVQLWASGDDELARWLPLATEIVNSIHFLDQ